MAYLERITLITNPNYNMETSISAEDLARIDKSNRAMEILAALPANQRTTLIEGLVAAMHLSAGTLSDIRKRTVAFSWWSERPEE
jgi:hypothetical protein